MTHEVSEAIETADCLIGAKRMLEAVARQGQPTYDAITPQDIADFIRAHREFRRFAVVMSGDTGFFSGTEKAAAAAGRLRHGGAAGFELVVLSVRPAPDLL